MLLRKPSIRSSITQCNRMSLTELMPVVQALPRRDRLRLVQLLVADLAREEGISLEENITPFPIWSPYNAYEAAAVLQEALESDS